ncbi:hypothetical protein C0J52_21914 [Blattella germanica]|nr:hypothetical protein C0J52_21914 [Blattella germanica]
MSAKDSGCETIGSSSLDVAQKESDDEGRDYYNAYEDLEVHYLMLTDSERNESYRKAIHSCRGLFEGKVVLDVGAGTGILSVLCAQAGAATVYAVEASNLATFIPGVATENGFSEVIKVLHQRVEDVELPCKVDIIVSEWMGFYLLHEGMLDSVLVARDRHLKPGGKLFPETASIWCAPCSIPKYYDFWEDVAGCRLKSIGEAWRKLKSRQPQVVELQNEDLLCDASKLCTLDLNRVTKNELDCISKSFVASSNRDGKYEGLCMWFSCEFPKMDDEAEATVLWTGPGKPSTHWKQTAIMLTDPVEVEECCPIAWELKLERRGPDCRNYNIELTELDPEKQDHPVPCKCYYTKCTVIRAYLEMLDKKENDDAERNSDPDSDTSVE